MSEGKSRKEKLRKLRGIKSGTKRVMNEPILKTLLDRSILSNTQLETLLIDLVVEDQIGTHIPYNDKATIRTKPGSKVTGVSRGAFNRTLKQARRNVTRCLYTMLLLAYLDLFDFSIFRPFEEIATKIGNYRRIREVLSGRDVLSNEDVESYRAAERTIIEALNELASSLILKSELSKRKNTFENDLIMDKK